VRQWAPVLTIVLLLFCSCSRRQDEGKAGLPGPVIQEAARPSPPTEITLQQEESPPLSALTPAKQEHVMLPLGRRGRALPEDFKIGLLQDRLAGYREQTDLLLLAGGFLDDLTRGRVRAEALLPDSAQEMTRYLDYYLHRGIVPTGYRLGSIGYSPDTGQARLGIRLFAQETAESALAASEGVLYLERRTEQWLIADLQIDLQSLSRPPAREERKFMPSSYRWLSGGS
jgi:hypothetical protein